VAQVLRELESTARAQQAAAKERAQQAAEQVIAEKREAADRVAAEILEEEEREQAAQTKVRLAPPSPHIGLHSVCSWVVSDAAFLSHGRAPPRSPHDVLGAWGAPQRKVKVKAKAGSGGAGGGPSTKAAAAAAGSSGQGSSRHSAPPGRIIGLSTEEPAVQAANPDGLLYELVKDGSWAIKDAVNTELAGGGDVLCWPPHARWCAAVSQQRRERCGDCHSTHREGSYVPAPSSALVFTATRFLFV
jgi:hypothetical protein